MLIGGIFIVYIETIKAIILQQTDCGPHEVGTKRRIDDDRMEFGGICPTSD